MFCGDLLESVGIYILFYNIFYGIYIYLMQSDLDYSVKSLLNILEVIRV